MGAAESMARSVEPLSALDLQVDNASDVNGNTITLDDAESVTFVIHPGTITDGTHTPKLQERDSGGTFSDVASEDVVGSLSDLASDTIQWVGYRGSKDEVRLVITVSGATTGGDYNAQAIKGHKRDLPTISN